MLIFNYVTHNATQLLCTLEKVNKLCFLILKGQIHYRNYACYTKRIASENSPWKVLFFSTDEFGLESLKMLHKKYDSKVLQRLEVVTKEQKNENPIMKYAKQNNILIHEWPIEINVSEFHIGVLVSFGYLIPSKIINAFPLGMINVHGSLLPRWRGAAPIIYTLMHGDSQAGITIMKIKPKKFDIGEIILQKQIDIDENETLPKLYTKLAKLGANLLEETFENLLELLQSAKPQDETKVTYAPKITSKLSLINWSEMSATIVYNLHRALLGEHAVTTSFQNIKIKLYDVQKFVSASITTKFEGEIPGTVMYDRKGKALIVKCKGETFVSVKKITVQGKRCMSAHDFYNGFICGKNKTKIYFS
ncbi:Methionyl-tRNA formyltransferase, mitochondrial [Anthophora retusa]